MSITISTAGHVDHGKSTLVEALTGVDPDRFAEEKARGLTIDLGFGSAPLPSGRSVSIIDVPGHERFIRNMLAGVGAVDACLFVVAANEGWMPQSEEHLRILELLGVSHGLIALTKVGLCDADIAELARLEVEERVEDTFLAGAPMVETDVVDDLGVDDLRAGLDDLVDRTPAAADLRRPRLWIDRAFAARGAGTVVTGTLTGGQIRVDDELELRPRGAVVRVRALQSHHSQRTKIGPGNRVAVNLSGVSHQEVVRGDVLVRAGQWHMTNRFDATLTVLSTLDHEVSRRGAHAIYVGACELPARMRILGLEALSPGEAGHVRLHLPQRLPLLPGDRFVLRESGRAETIGGGTVLDIDPVLAASRARPDLSIDRVVAERGWVEAERLALLTGQRREPDVGRWVVSPTVLKGSKARLRAAVDDAGPLGLDIAGLDEKDRAVLSLMEEMATEGGRVRPIGQSDPFENHRYTAALEAAPFTPPDPEAVGVDRSEVRELVKRGVVVEQDGVFFAASTLVAARSAVAEMLADQPDGVTVAEVRERLETTRKYALPLLAWLDGQGATRRRGDVRIAGPRL
ncbi:MAG: selenocysteine-specific translation elongation factor [Acidimicrobiia bacterium]|nr:selenocysteine-specific translation elongation factor [Acidimicrobiia bacterium]MYG59200.1 selenocysteine-specific translation elongation factor [Acidimicrobiia bacterium]MYJ32408.1 selenocysteine-specific translation elongation factor [Acidimicrobiia bacterium]